MFTGKGGVGKTTLAMAYSLFLHQQNKKVRYFSADQKENSFYCRQLAVPYQELSSSEIIAKYIGRKLHSPLLAKWICQTDFFQAAFDLIPALGHLLCLGQLVEYLQQDPELYLVLDAPASGHARSMFEASNNFREIFQSGIIFKDIYLLQEYLQQQQIIHTWIVTTPHEMAMEEAEELRNFFATLKFGDNSIILNQSMELAIHPKDRTNLPAFLHHQIVLENEMLQKFSLMGKVPYFPQEHPTKVIQQINEYFIHECRNQN